MVTRNISHFKQVSPTLGPTATLGEDNSTQRETEPNDFVHNDELNPTALSGPVTSGTPHYPRRVAVKRPEYLDDFVA